MQACQRICLMAMRLTLLTLLCVGMMNPLGQAHSDSRQPAAVPDSPKKADEQAEQAQATKQDKKDKSEEEKKSCDGKSEDKGKALKKDDDSSWPIRPKSAPAPPAKTPVPQLPPGFGMGGYPTAPQRSDNPESLQQFIQDSLSVRLRGAGVTRVYGLLRGDLDFATARFNPDLVNPFFAYPDDSRFRAGSSAVPVKPNDINYVLTPRLTRFGVEYYGEPIQQIGNAVVNGRLEIDFQTGQAAVNQESRELPRLRSAYLAMTWDEFTLLAGQDWDIIAPLTPSSNDNSVFWNAGNLGDRRPIIKFLWAHDLGGERILQVQNALALGDAVKNPDIDNNGQRDQESSGIPGYQGRLGLMLPSHVEGEKLLAGVWGLLAIERTNGTLPPPPFPIPGQADPKFSQLTNQRFLARAIGCDLRLPLCPGLTFQGEAWAGQNLGDFRGGVGQGVNFWTGRPVRAMGGWVELVCRPVDWYQLAFGTTIDKPNRQDVEGFIQPFFVGFPQGINREAGITRNWYWYIGNRFFLGGGVTAAIEYLHAETNYVGYHPGRGSIIKFALMQAF